MGLLAYERALERAGVPNAAAFTDALKEAFDDHLATKADIVGVERRIDAVERRIDAVELKLTGRMDAAEARLIAEIHKALNRQLFAYGGLVAAFLTLSRILDWTLK